MNLNELKQELGPLYVRSRSLSRQLHPLNFNIYLKEHFCDALGHDSSKLWLNLNKILAKMQEFRSA